MKDKLLIFDTTLRDGEQSPGASLSMHQKLEIARILAKLNVDYIEAGFPVSSKEQFDAVQAIAQEIPTGIAALARAKDTDIEAAARALKGAKKPRIHTFIGTSDFHILGKLSDLKYGRTLAEKRANVIKMSQEAIRCAKSYVSDVEFSAEDAGRTDFNYLCEILEAAIEAGATTLNIPDTTGYKIPFEFGNLIQALTQKVKGIDKVILSVHCHNDLGLAVANSLSAVLGGARQVECTINGIGERAGNASLEELVMAIKVRKDLMPVETNIRTQELYNASRMVSSYTGMIVQPNKAIVGENAFAHESGIHQDGMLKNRDTYEIMEPEEVGFPGTKIVLGRHSGRHGLKSRLSHLGYTLSSEELDHVYDEFVILADKKKEVFDEDLRALMGDTAGDSPNKDLLTLKSFQVTSGSQAIPTATVFLFFHDQMIQGAAVGDGPVDACFNAIENALGVKPKLDSYQVRSITGGRQAMGEAIIRIRSGDHLFSGRAVSTDVLKASAEAYVHAINQLLKVKKLHSLKKPEAKSEIPISYSSMIGM